MLGQGHRFPRYDPAVVDGNFDRNEAHGLTLASGTLDERMISKAHVPM
jgi:hypothetical protein